MASDPDGDKLGYFLSGFALGVSLATLVFQSTQPGWGDFLRSLGIGR